MYCTELDNSVPRELCFDLLESPVPFGEDHLVRNVHWTQILM